VLFHEIFCSWYCYILYNFVTIIIYKFQKMYLVQFHYFLPLGYIVSKFLFLLQSDVIYKLLNIYKPSKTATEDKNNFSWELLFPTTADWNIFWDMCTSWCRSESISCVQIFRPFFQPLFSRISTQIMQNNIKWKALQRFSLKYC
jgi:hypothetical protein